MIAVVQRVTKSIVNIPNLNYQDSIENGLLVLTAISPNDTEETLKWMANKIVNLRIFPDENGKMNLSVKDINGEIMVISNFTLYGDASRGFRPNFMYSAPPDFASQMFDKFVQILKENFSNKVATGIFGEFMNIELINSGPVTIIIQK